MNLKSWKIISSRYALQTKWVTIRQDTVELPNGEVIDDYYVREMSEIVKVFVLREDGRVVMNRQYKHGCAKVVTELPAGMVDPGETPEQAAHRELREEAGYGLDTLQHLTTFDVSPTSANGRLHIFYGEGARTIGGKDHDNQREVIDNVFPTVDELRAMVLRGEVSAEGSVAAILFTLEWLRSRENS